MDSATKFLKVQADDDTVDIQSAKHDVDAGKKRCKIYCVSCRECCCCSTGSIIAAIVGVAGFLMFILLSAKSVSPESEGCPSKVVFIAQSTSIGSDYVYLEWKPPSILGGAYISSYALQLRNSNDSDTNFSSIFMVDKGLDKKHNVSNLNGSTMYDFRITAKNGAGFTGNFSGIYTVTTEPATIPQSPGAPFPMNITQNKDLVAFTMGIGPTSNGGSAITSYSIYYGLNGNHTQYTTFCTIKAEQIAGLSEYNYPNCTGTMTSSELTQLYNFRSSSKNSIGNSPFSVFTPCIIPASNIDLYMCSLTEPPTMIENSSITLSVSPYEIDVQWTPPGCKQYTPILQYQFQRTDFWTATPLQNITIPNNGLSMYAQISGLISGVPYQMRLRAINKFGAGPWSNILVTTTAKGGCGNYADDNILRVNCAQMPSLMMNTWLSCNGDDQCQTSKIESELGLSPDCTECEVKFNDCSMGHCLQQCLHESPAKCQACITVQCGDMWAECTGWEHFAEPPCPE